MYSFGQQKFEPIKYRQMVDENEEEELGVEPLKKNCLDLPMQSNQDPGTLGYKKSKDFS